MSRQYQKQVHITVILLKVVRKYCYLVYNVCNNTSIRKYFIFQNDNKVTGKSDNKVKITKFFLRTMLLISVDCSIFAVSDL